MATNEQVPDVLTKPLSKVKFEYFRDKLGQVPHKMKEGATYRILVTVAGQFIYR